MSGYVKKCSKCGCIYPQNHQNKYCYKKGFDIYGLCSGVIVEVDNQPAQKEEKKVKEK